MRGINKVTLFLFAVIQKLRYRLLKKNVHATVAVAGMGSIIVKGVLAHRLKNKVNFIQFYSYFFGSTAEMSPNEQ